MSEYGNLSGLCFIETAFDYNVLTPDGIPYNHQAISGTGTIDEQISEASYLVTYRYDGLETEVFRTMSLDDLHPCYFYELTEQYDETLSNVLEILDRLNEREQMAATSRDMQRKARSEQRERSRSFDLVNA